LTTATQADSLRQAQQRTEAALREALQKLNELNTRMDYEVAANHERIESFKEITNQLFWLFVVIGSVATIFGTLVALRSAKQQSELHGKVLRIYESQAVVGERYRDHSGQILDLQESYSRGMAEITTAFRDILDNVKSVLGFRIEEGKMALEAMQSQEKAARLLPEIQNELAELRKERDAQMDELVSDTSRLKRSRHEYTEPDRELNAAFFQFRIKMDGLPKPFLSKYADQPQYAPVFYYRGLIAFIDNDVPTAHKILKAEGSPQQAQAELDKALQLLRESKHLETKPERSTQIMLNTLAYLCLREANPEEARSHRITVNEHLAKVREVNGFEMKLFSFKKKQAVSKDEFLGELMD
jgi:hypothetical protein